MVMEHVLASRLSRNIKSMIPRTNPESPGSRTMKLTQHAEHQRSMLHLTTELSGSRLGHDRARSTAKCLATAG